MIQCDFHMYGFKQVSKACLHHVLLTCGLHSTTMVTMFTIPCVEFLHNIICIKLLLEPLPICRFTLICGSSLRQILTLAGLAFLQYICIYVLSKRGQKTQTKQILLYNCIVWCQLNQQHFFQQLKRCVSSHSSHICKECNCCVC